MLGTNERNERGGEKKNKLPQMNNNQRHSSWTTPPQANQD